MSAPLRVVVRRGRRDAGHEIACLLAPLAELGAIPGFSLAYTTPDCAGTVSWGCASLKSGAPVTEDTSFALASTTKPFAALIMAWLGESGHIDLSAPVARALPELTLPDAERTAALSANDLLSMRSGLGSSEGGPRLVARSRHDLLTRLGAIPPARPFREGYVYSTDNFTILGALTARAGGRSWAQTARRLVWEPLGMTSTDASVVLATGRDSWASPHIPHTDGAVCVARRYEDHVATPAGGMNASASDMLLWISALLDQDARLPLPDALHRASSSACERIAAPFDDSLLAGWNLPPGRSARGAAYGAGWEHLEIDGHPLLLHQGRIDGFRALSLLAPRLRLGLHLFTNADPAHIVTAMALTALDVLCAREPAAWLSGAPGPALDPIAFSGSPGERAIALSIDGPYGDAGAFGGCFVWFDGLRGEMRFPGEVLALSAAGEGRLAVWRRHLFGLRPQFFLEAEGGEERDIARLRTSRGEVFFRTPA